MTTTSGKRVALYARVSTTDQTTDNQLLDLRRYADERGWHVINEYVDQGISGTKDNRPALDALMDAARKRQVDVVLVWRFDRFARSVRHLLLSLDEFRQLKIDFVSYQENIDTSSALGQAIFTIIAAMAELERNIIVERVQGGLRRARAQGKRLGRPRRVLDVGELLRLHQQGWSLRRIARHLGLSKSSVWRVLKTLD